MARSEERAYPSVCKRRATQPAGIDRVGEGELCSPEPIAGSAEPAQGSAIHRRGRGRALLAGAHRGKVRNPPRVPQSIGVSEGELCSPEPIAGSAEPAQGSALDRPRPC